MRTIRKSLSAAALLASLPWSASAQTPPPASPPPPPPSGEVVVPEGMEGMAADSAAMEMITEIVVTGHRERRSFDGTVSVAALDGEALATSARATIGDTLATLPGVSSTSFGPSAARPVLRGFQGERTRLLIDDIPTLDVSGTSPDHAVAINPFAAERIEVLRGPIALAFASGAVGGVVNTVTQRIPRRDVERTKGAFNLVLASASDQASFGGGIETPLTPGVTVHVDGHYLNAADVEIGGSVLSPQLRNAALASPDPAIRALAGLGGRLPNTAAESYDISAGATWFGAAFDLGAAVSYTDSQYGLPTRLSLDPAATNPDSRIVLDQIRIDGRARWRPGGAIEEVRLRAGLADYAHDEILVPSDERTARFLNLGWEARLEVVTRPLAPLLLAVGAQAQGRNFSVLSDAPLLPPNRTRSYAGFVHGELDLSPLKLEASARYERTNSTSDVDPLLGNVAVARSFDAVSVSLGANYRVGSALSLGVNAQYGERAPVVEELFTQGTDPGTQGVLLGNPAIGIERSWGIEGVVRGFAGPFTLEASAYYYRFPNYIYASETGTIADGLPVFSFLANRASYRGFEVQLRADLARIGGVRVRADALVDMVSASLGDGSPVPRIPPLRLLGGIDATHDIGRVRIDLEYVTPQRRVSAFETTTEGYVSLGMAISVRPFGKDSPLLVTLQGTNLLDEDARRHASFLKDFAPIAGRDIRLTGRVTF